MANKVSNVVAGKPKATGGVLLGSMTTPLPTDGLVVPDAGFKAAGYVGDKGLVEKFGRSTSKVKAWGGDIVKILQTDQELSYQFAFIESVNSDVLKAVYGAQNVAITPATAGTTTLTSVLLNSTVLPFGRYVFEMKDGLATIRVVLPNAQIVDLKDVTYDDGTIIMYDVTVECFPDASGNKGYKYLNDGQLLAA